MLEVAKQLVATISSGEDYSKLDLTDDTDGSCKDEDESSTSVPGSSSLNLQ